VRFSATSFGVLLLKAARIGFFHTHTHLLHHLLSQADSHDCFLFLFTKSAFFSGVYGWDPRIASSLPFLFSLRLNGRFSPGMVYGTASASA
jgi:hypothetical protein